MTVKEKKQQMKELADQMGKLAPEAEAAKMLVKQYDKLADKFKALLKEVSPDLIERDEKYEGEDFIANAHFTPTNKLDQTMVKEQYPKTYEKCLKDGVMIKLTVVKK